MKATRAPEFDCPIPPGLPASEGCVTITMSANEAKWLKHLSLMNITIPNALQASSEKPKVYSFLNRLAEALHDGGINSKDRT